MTSLINNNILLVDDIPANLSMLRQMLTTQGYRVRPALSGEIALKAVQVDAPDLILMDIMMPGLNGFEVCSRLKSAADTCDIPVLFISVRNETEMKIKAFEVGGVGFITKPFQTAEVMARITTHLTIRNTQKKKMEQNTQLLSEVEDRKQAEKILEKSNQKLEQFAFIDALTEIPNRRYFDHYLQQEWKHSVRDKIPMVTIICNIDDFKLYNDTYGHVAGDKCLQQVAQGIHHCIKRPVDLVARYGGEEFAVIMPNTNIEGALTVAKHIKKEIGELKIPHIQSKASRYVSLSMGANSLIPDRFTKPETFINTADQFLYKAKAAGKDCIMAIDS